MYLMASQEGFTSFIRNPRKFLLPPQPAPPCKIVVLGGLLSGKTTLCERLKERYKAAVRKRLYNRRLYHQLCRITEALIVY